MMPELMKVVAFILAALCSALVFTSGVLFMCLIQGGLVALALFVLLLVLSASVAMLYYGFMRRDQ